MKRIISLITSAALAASLCVMPGIDKGELSDTLIINADAREEMQQGAGRTIPDGSYWIHCRTHYNDMIFPNGALSEEDAKQHVMVKTNESTLNEENAFKITYLNNGYYSIVQSSSNMSLDVPKTEEVEQGTALEYYPFSGKDDISQTTENQQWSIELTDYGYIIRSRYCGYVLDIMGGKVSLSDVAELCLYPEKPYDPDDDSKADNQRFLFIPCRMKDEGKLVMNYKGNYITSAVSKKLCLDAEGYPDDFDEGKNVQIYNQNDDTFSIAVYDSNGYFELKAENKNASVTATGYYLAQDSGYGNNSHSKQGANVSLTAKYFPRDMKGHRAQLWYALYNKNGTYTFLNRLSGYALTMDGYNVCVMPYTGAANQQWLIGTSLPLDLPGDADGNGLVDLQDVMIMQQYIAGWDVSIVPANANVSGDDRIDITDVLILQQYIAKWDVELV